MDNMNGRYEFIDDDHILKETSMEIIDLICDKLGYEDIDSSQVCSFVNLMLDILSYSMITLIESIYEEKDIESKLKTINHIFDSCELSMKIRCGFPRQNE